MARGGSGDILTGILGALAAHKSGRTPMQNAAAACEIHGLAGEGLLCHGVSNEQELQKAMDILLGAAPVKEGSLRDRQIAAFWHFHVGGEPDEP